MLQSNLQSMKWSNFYLDSRLSARMVSSSTNQKMNIVTNELVEQHEETTNDLMLVRNFDAEISLLVLSTCILLSGNY